MSDTNISSSKRSWDLSSDGTKDKTLLESEKGLQISIIKLSPEQKIPHHTHTQVRYNFILQGSMSDERDEYKQGDLVINPQGSSHTVTASSQGCEFLVFGEKQPFVGKE